MKLVLLVGILLLAGCASSEVVLDFHDVREKNGKVIGFAPIDGANIGATQKNCVDYAVARAACDVAEAARKVSIRYVTQPSAIQQNSCDPSSGYENYLKCLERAHDLLAERLRKVDDWRVLDIDVGQLRNLYRWKCPEGRMPAFDWGKEIHVRLSWGKGDVLNYTTYQVWRSAASTSHNPWQ